MNTKITSMYPRLYETEYGSIFFLTNPTTGIKLTKTTKPCPINSDSKDWPIGTYKTDWNFGPMIPYTGTISN